MTDSGWILLYGNEDYGHVKYRIKNGFCTIKIIASSTIQTAGDINVIKLICTLPANARPSLEVIAPLSWQGNWKDPIYLKIAVNGQISIWSPYASNYFTGIITYPIN